MAGEGTPEQDANASGIPKAIFVVSNSSSYVFSPFIFFIDSSYACFVCFDIQMILKLSQKSHPTGVSDSSANVVSMKT